MIKGATVQSSKTNYGRRGTKDYLQLGYVPLNHHSLLTTLWIMLSLIIVFHKLLKKLGKDDIAQKYAQQAKNYRNIFDPVTGLCVLKILMVISVLIFSLQDGGETTPRVLLGKLLGQFYMILLDLLVAMVPLKLLRKKLIKLCNQRPDFNVEGYWF